MKTLFLFLIMGLPLCANITLGQEKNLQFYLYDEETKTPINNTHAFMVNTTYGSVSDQTGQIKLSFPASITEDILLTHVAYEDKLLIHSEYRKINIGDTLWLAPNHFDLKEIVVTSKKSNVWKKRYKRFKKVFLGEDKPATKCEILNPEVIYFEEEKGVLTATALDFIHIKNNYLGYEIKYHLNQLTIENDGSSTYLGKASYTDIKTSNNEKEILKKRQLAYESSPKHFFYSLIQNKLETAGYEVEICVFKNNKFSPLGQPTGEELLQKVPNQNLYKVRFSQFLKILNKNQRIIRYEKTGLQAGGQESQKFSGTINQEREVVEYAISYLFKVSPYLYLNPFGNVLNTQHVKEYGFWANQRMAHQLPFNYGNDYTLQELSSVEPKLHTTPISTETKQPSVNPSLKRFTTLLLANNSTIQSEILEDLEANWKLEYAAPLIEILNLSNDNFLLKEIPKLLAQKTGQNRDMDYLSRLEWLWEKESAYGDYYGDFKATLYKYIDPKFERYFKGRQKTATISLDEIVWGGVKQDGIPPLRNPKLLNAEEATYLNDKDIVFGLYINGEAKAYPKRILAWHEFFTDRFGSTAIAGVYCTLCGTVIAYDKYDNGVFHDLGTSGFLYRSNKLMYDKATQSLWNTIEGKPVMGPLANKNIILKTHPVVTTNWGNWKKLHPETKVLSLNTDYNRDYGEGIAYQRYFATDDLMFPVPKLDTRLANKAEVFIIRAPNYRTNPLAISVDYLKKKKLYQGQIGTTNFLAIADKTGAARAYDVKNSQFQSYKRGILKDTNGKIWTVTETHLQSTDNQQLERISGHNIFWFAWFNAYPETRLVN